MIETGCVSCGTRVQAVEKELNRQRRLNRWLFVALAVALLSGWAVLLARPAASSQKEVRA